jgi:GNAT superfamily N-acetyltransferase
MPPPSAAGAAPVLRRVLHLARKPAGPVFEAVVFTGPGPELLAAVAREADCDRLAVLDEIVNRLLVRKGADWTAAILAEYLGLYQDSCGTFTLVWEKRARQLVAHGAVFQSREHPQTAVVAHIRTADDYNGLGLGTLATAEVTRAAFARGADVVCLATDDKRHRLGEGERAAHRMYSRLGYAVLARKELADTLDWLLVIDRQVFDAQQAAREGASGRFPEISPVLAAQQQALVERIQAELSGPLAGGRIQPAGDGDLAGLFLLLNLGPPDDFRLKLAPWGVQLGPEIERSYVVTVRPAIADRDRLEDASLVLRTGDGRIAAVCAARQAAPFARTTFEIDVYCLPRFLAADRAAVTQLVAATLSRIERSSARPRPCRLLFCGADVAKTRLFAGLGFAPAGNRYPYFGPDGQTLFAAEAYERLLP